MKLEGSSSGVKLEGNKEFSNSLLPESLCRISSSAVLHSFMDRFSIVQPMA